MTFPNWYDAGQFAHGSHKKYFVPKVATHVARKGYARSRRPVSLSRPRLWLALSLMVLLSATALYLSHTHQLENALAPLTSSRSPLTPSSSPTLFVSPSVVPIVSVGTTFTVQIKVQNMLQFNGWDIQVFAYTTAINATSLSITGNDFEVNASAGTPFEIVHCVNGKGTGCTSTDGPGIVHSAYGNTGILTGNGLLFTITYQATGPYATCGCSGYSPIVLQNDLISSPSSGNGVPHATIIGGYGQPLAAGAGGGTPPREA